MMGMDYGSGGHAPAMMFNPFMMQHPLMMQHQQQHPGTAWGAGMMQQQVRGVRRLDGCACAVGCMRRAKAPQAQPACPAQSLQGGSWYGGMQMGRGMHTQMGMAGPYAAYPGYYPMSQGRAGGGAVRVDPGPGWAAGWALYN